MDRQTYWETLTHLVHTHADVITAALHMPSGSLSAAELAVVVNFSLGHELRGVFSTSGSLHLQDLGKALKTLSRQQRDPCIALKALKWHDRLSLANKRMIPLTGRNHLFKPAVERAFQRHRLQHAAQSLGQIIHNQNQLTDALSQVVSDLELVECADTPPAKLQAHFRTIRSLFRSSEWHARMAVVWAFRNGLVPERIADSLVRAYIRPIIRIADQMQAVEDRLQLNTEQRPSATARRGARRLAMELMDVTRQSPSRSRNTIPEWRIGVLPV